MTTDMYFKNIVKLRKFLNLLREHNLIIGTKTTGMLDNRLIFDNEKHYNDAMKLREEYNSLKLYGDKL